MKAGKAAIEAARPRLRPILITSFAFIFALIPLIIATGAGAEIRQALGTVVTFGMLGVTFFGVFLNAVFNALVRRMTGQRRAPSGKQIRSVAASADSEDRPRSAARTGSNNNDCR
jgi:HAE1 family hydrophobic/amphiphilic exporter-1